MERPWVTSPSYEAAFRVLILARQERGISQRELAERLGKPRSFVSKIEGRERRIDIVEFVAFAEALGFEAGDLMRLVSTAMTRPITF